MKFKNVCLESIAHCLPEEILTSAEIENRLESVYNRLKLKPGRFELFTGIKERRVWPKGTTPSHIASIAGRKALEHSGIPPEDIGCLINASVCRDYLEPATASIIHQKLNLNDNTLVFDISNACLGFLNAMVCATNMIEMKIIKSALIVGGENSRLLLDSTIDMLTNDKNITRQTIKKSFASLTIGSGAAAILLTHSSISRKKHFLLGGAYLSSSKDHHLCTGGKQIPEYSENNRYNILMETDSEPLMKNGCLLAKQTWDKAKDILEISNNDVQKYICHQVGKPHQKLFFDLINDSISKDITSYEKLGNMGSVSLPATLSLGIENKLIKKDNLIALVGVASGLNSIILGIRW